MKKYYEEMLKAKNMRMNKKLLRQQPNLYDLVKKLTKILKN